MDALTAGITALLPASESDDAGPVSGTVFKVERGPAGERIAYVRMFSGTLGRQDRVQVREDDERKVTSIDWRTYHSLPLGFDVPEVESVLIKRNGVEASGAGETAITIVAAAVGNAVFDATGARIREVPFTPERIVAALRARS